tara:strand:+ start:236 stop:778 length:543 start_codon:yes stop_codon:yes gene_type:complete
MDNINYVSDEKWSQDTECVYAWLENNDTIYNGSIEQILNAAQENPNDRKKQWEALRALLNVCPNNPIKRGRRSSIDAEVLARKDSLSEDFRQGVCAALKHTNFKDLVMPRGGYAFYDEDNTLEDYMWGQVSNMLEEAYRNHIAEDTDLSKRQWDGTLNKDGTIAGKIICGVKVVTGEEEE